VVARAVVAAVAIVVIAWLGVMERDHRLLLRGAAPGASFAAADNDLRAARFLNPDTTPDLARAFLLFHAGRRQEAVAAIERVLRREPDNLYAWDELRTVASGNDPAVLRRAESELRRLDPIGSRGH